MRTFILFFQKSYGGFINIQRAKAEKRERVLITRGNWAIEMRPSKEGWWSNETDIYYSVTRKTFSHFSFPLHK